MHIMPPKTTKKEKEESNEINETNEEKKEKKEKKDKKEKKESNDKKNEEESNEINDKKNEEEIKESNEINVKKNEQKEKKVKKESNEKKENQDINENEKQENGIIKPKRGRKSKKDLLNNLNLGMDFVTTQKINSCLNVNVNVLENDSNLQISVNEILINSDNDLNNNLILESENQSADLLEDDNLELDEENVILKNDIKSISKKRGRKPKGGKIIQNLTPLNNDKKNKPNIILHLKCYLKDLNPNNLLGNVIESYNFANKNDLTYDLINNTVNNSTSSSNNISNNNKVETVDYEADEEEFKDNNHKELWKKIKQLETNLHINNTSDKKSACFWCTYDFDNPPIYIPKYFLKNSYHVYGCFCSPECGTAFLMEENIDSSTKFERYHFINHLYAKIYNYEKINIYIFFTCRNFCFFCNGTKPSDN